MLAIGNTFIEFRQQQRRALELMENLKQECLRLEHKLQAGIDLSEQCRQMKKSANSDSGFSTTSEAEEP